MADGAVGCRRPIARRAEATKAGFEDICARHRDYIAQIIPAPRRPRLMEQTEQLLKFVLGDHARGDFYGRLLIAEDAQQTTALQTNRNLLLSPTAVMRTRPQLEIYADDVKASHGASIGQLDETALFYMRQRGVDYETARKLLIGAFLYEIVNTIEDEGERNEVITSLGLSQN